MNHSPVRFPRSIADNHRRWLYAIGWILVGSPSIFGPAGAAPIVTGIHTTALAAPPPAITASDPYWRVVALPETPVFLAYEASLFSGRGPSFQVPATWFHGADGFGGGGWIGHRSNIMNLL